MKVLSELSRWNVRMYEAFFSLKTLPFLTLPQTDFFQPLPDHALVVQTVMHAIQQGDGLIQVVGEVGSGKTMTLRYILHQLKEHPMLCYFPHGAMPPNALARHLLVELGAEVPASDALLWSSIQDVFLTRMQEGQRCLIFVDEAQTFDVSGLEWLRLLSNLESAEHKWVQMILFGQPELLRLLEQPELRQLKSRIHERLMIGAPSCQQLEYYLIERLKVAGHPHGQLFQPSAVRLLFRGTQGILRWVNIVAHKAMLHAFAFERGHVASVDVAHALFEAGCLRSAWMRGCLRLRYGIWG